MSAQTQIAARLPSGLQKYQPGLTGGGAGLSPVNPIAPPRIPGGGFGAAIPDTPSDATQAIQTVADAYLAALGSQPADVGSTVVVPTPPAEGGSSVNIKSVVLIAALAAAAWFLYKKFGPKSDG